MAELSEFFARKDKKKNIIGTKFTTANDLEKKLQETDFKKERTTLKKSTDIEWNDFEETKKDYTGLKIQNITLVEEDDEKEINTGNEDVDAKVLETPFSWKVTHSEEESDEKRTANPVEENTEVKTIINNATSTAGVYVPPHLRSKNTIHTKSQTAKTKLNCANEEMFPYLLPSNPVHSEAKRCQEDILPAASTSSAPAAKIGVYIPPHLRNKPTIYNQSQKTAHALPTSVSESFNASISSTSGSDKADGKWNKPKQTFEEYLAQHP